MIGEAGCVLLGVTAPERIGIGLPGYFGRSRPAPWRAVGREALDLAGDRCHGIQCAVRMEKLPHAHTNGRALRPPHVKACPPGEVLTKVEDVDAFVDLGHADRGQPGRHTDRREW